jgi:hypothetical protein
VLGAFVNLFRSIPFLILMVALIPFTRGGRHHLRRVGGVVPLTMPPRRSSRGLPRSACARSTTA